MNQNYIYDISCAQNNKQNIKGIVNQRNGDTLW